MYQKTAIRLLLVVLVAFVSMGSPDCGGDGPYPSGDPQRGAESHLDFSPAWSPDGEFIITYAGYGLHGVQTDGSEAWQIRKRKRDFLSSPDISIDGRLAFQAGRDNSWVRDLLEAFAFPDREENRIELADVDVKKVKRVASVDVPFRRIPKWSPDGQLLAYSLRYWRGFVVLDRMGNQVGEFNFWQPGVGFIDGFDKFIVKQLAWAPGSDRLAMVAVHTDPNLTEADVLITVRADGNDLRTVRRAAEGIALAAPAWTPDGEHILYVQGPVRHVYAFDGSPSSIQSVRPDGSDQRVLVDLSDVATPWRGIATPGMLSEEIHVCPNGKDLLLVTRGMYFNHAPRSYSSGISSLHAANTDTGELDLITYEQDALFASWSPDCSRIAVASPYRDDVMLYTMNADGSDPQVLLERNERGKIKPGHSRPLQDE
ncbi:MAG: hypothetical protein OXF79_04660 [Chloroflexi bacterium]|nr:hypothetical protein [Chloroflexota bacterium]